MADESNNRSAEKTKNEAEIVSIDLPAPPGWLKKFMSKKGGTPRRNEIVFFSPTGEQIKSKRQLDQYLKTHPGGPESSDFDWGTGGTPRRSARLVEKVKAEETPEGEKPKKREKKSSSKKGAKGNDVEEIADVEMKEADKTEENAEGDGVTAEVDVDKSIAVEGVGEGAIEKDSENKTEGDVKEIPVDVEEVADVEMKEADKTDENVEGDGVTADVDVDNSVAVEGVGEGAIEKDSENKTEGDVKEIPVDVEEVADVEMKDADKTDENVEGDGVTADVDVDNSVAVEGVGEGAIEKDSENKTGGDVKEIPVESTGMKEQEEGAGEGAVEKDSENRTGGDAKEIPAESTGTKEQEEGAGEGAVEKDSENKTGGDAKEIPAESTGTKDEEEGVGEGAVEKDSEKNKTEGDAKEIPAESTGTKEEEEVVGEGAVEKDSEKNKEEIPVESSSEKKDVQEVTGKVDDAASYLNKDQKAAGSNPTNSEALEAFDPIEVISAENGENEHKE